VYRYRTRLVIVQDTFANRKKRLPALDKSTWLKLLTHMVEKPVLCHTRIVYTKTRVMLTDISNLSLHRMAMWKNTVKQNQPQKYDDYVMITSILCAIVHKHVISAAGCSAWC